jgi:hypothetical protein
MYIISVLRVAGVLSNVYVLFVEKGLKNVMNAWNEKRNKHLPKLILNLVIIFVFTDLLSPALTLTVVEFSNRSLLCLSHSPNTIFRAFRGNFQALLNVNDLLPQFVAV